MLCVYHLDARLTITSVGPGWDDFALANGAPELVWPGPRGRPLLLYFADATTLQIYELLFERVARRRRAVSFPIRCDAPHLRRFLEVEIEPRTGGGFSVYSWLLRGEERRRVALLDPAAPRGQSSIAICSWCKRVNVEGRWMDVEEAVTTLQLFARREQPQVVQDTCPECRDSMETLLRDHRAEK